MNTVPIKKEEAQLPAIGIELSPTGLHVNGELNESQIEQVFKFLSSRETSLAWYIGDFLVYLYQSRSPQYAQEFANRCLSPRRANEYLLVCSEFPAANRITEGATYSHHEAALRETNDPGYARKWVALAAEESLTVQDMVHRIRSANQLGEREKGNQKEPAYNPQVKEIYNLSLRCRKLRIDQFDSANRKKLVEALEPAVELYRQLRGEA